MGAHATLVAVTEPDVAVVDIRMPSDGGSGLRAHARPPPSARRRPRALPLRPPQLRLRAPRRVHRAGWVPASKIALDNLAELADAVRRVGQGGSVLDPVLVPQLVGRPREGPTRFTT